MRPGLSLVIASPFGAAGNARSKAPLLNEATTDVLDLRLANLQSLR